MVATSRTSVATKKVGLRPTHNVKGRMRKFPSRTSVTVEYRMSNEILGLLVLTKSNEKGGKCQQPDDFISCVPRNVHLEEDIQDGPKAT
jgi:hypothetical protein